MRRHWMTNRRRVRMSTSTDKPKAGLEDVVAGESAICYLDGDRGVLAYQGYDVHDLANADVWPHWTAAARAEWARERGH